MASSNMGDWSQLLANKVVFLTGAGGRLAKYIAKTCYAQEARLVLGDLDPKLMTEVLNELTTKEDKKEDRILIVKLDVTDETSIYEAVKTTLDKWKTIDVLLNVAANLQFGQFEELSPERWSRIFDVNVRGYVSMAKYIAPVFRKQNSGSIINIASTLGLIAIPNASAYSASKAAILQLTRNLALELGSFNIRVNSISPGLINMPTMLEFAGQSDTTEEILRKAIASASCLKRLVEAQEIANLVVFLASDLCQFMTGANLVVDGGHSII